MTIPSISKCKINANLIYWGVGGGVCLYMCIMFLVQIWILLGVVLTVLEFVGLPSDFCIIMLMKKTLKHCRFTIIDPVISEMEETYYPYTWGKGTNWDLVSTRHLMTLLWERGTRAGRESWSTGSASHIHSIERRECGFLNLGLRSNNAFLITDWAHLI